MGFLDKFRRKKKDNVLADIEKLDKEKSPTVHMKSPKQAPTQSQISVPEPQTQLSQTPDFKNIRAKIDLVLTEIDSLKTQNQTINERLKSIEKSLADMKGIRYY